MTAVTENNCNNNKETINCNANALPVGVCNSPPYPEKVQMSFVGRSPLKESASKRSESRSTFSVIQEALRNINPNYGSSCFNLTNAIMGSGILGLPSVMHSLGYGMFAILLMLVAFAALFAIDSLLYCCNATGLSSFEGLAERAYGKRMKQLTCVILWLHGFAAVCSYMTIVKQELPEVIMTIWRLVLKDSGQHCLDDIPAPWWLDGNHIFTLVLLAFVVPLASLRKIDFLSFTSALAMICMLIFSGIVISQYDDRPDCPLENPSLVQVGLESSCLTVRFIDANTNRSITESNSKEFAHFEEAIREQTLRHARNEDTCYVEFISDSWGWKQLSAIPTMVFAFMCHASVLPIYTELRPRTRHNMLAVAKTAIVVNFVAYMSVALFAYMTFRETTVLSEVLLMYSKTKAADVSVLVARICSLICVIFSAPLLHYPCRKALIMALFGTSDFKWTRHLSVMAFNLCMVWMLVKYMQNSLGDILTYTGIIPGNFLVLIFPSLFYLRLCCRGKYEGEQLNDTDCSVHVTGGEKPSLDAVTNVYGGPRRKLYCKFMAGLGIFMLVAMLIMTAYKDLK